MCLWVGCGQFVARVSLTENRDGYNCMIVFMGGWVLASCKG